MRLCAGVNLCTPGGFVTDDYPLAGVIDVDGVDVLVRALGDLVVADWSKYSL
jgi:hypothetical protein